MEWELWGSRGGDPAVRFQGSGDQWVGMGTKVGLI